MKKSAISAALAQLAMLPNAHLIFNGPPPNLAIDADLKLDLSKASDEDLRQNISDLASRASAICEMAESEGREPSADEAARVQKLERLQAAADGELSNRRLQPRKTQPDLLPNARSTVGGPSGRSGDISPSSTRNGIILPENRANVGQLIFGSSRGPWENTNDFFVAMRNGHQDPRLFQAGNNEGTGTEGGFTVPTEFYRGIIEQALQQSEYAIRCRVFPSPSNSIFIPMPDVQNRTTGIAGLNAQWSGESQQGGLQTMKFRAVEMRLKKLMLLASASNELLEDGVNFDTQLRTAMGQDAAYKLDASIIAGSGVGQPRGFIGHASVIGIDPESGQAADTVLYMNLVKMFARLAPSCQKRATWFIAPSVLTQLLFMTFPGNDTLPVLLSGGQNDAAAGAPAGTIFGRPVVVTELSRTLGDAGDIVLADMSQYALLLKASAQIEWSPHVRFDHDDSVWRLRLRVDGQPMWDEPITPPNAGEPTLSWATYLNPRD